MPSPDNPVLTFGPYVLWETGDSRFGLMSNETGEIGIFEKEQLISYLHAFFGLNF